MSLASASIDWYKVVENVDMMIFDMRDDDDDDDDVFFCVSILLSLSTKAKKKKMKSKKCPPFHLRTR